MKNAGTATQTAAATPSLKPSPQEQLIQDDPPQPAAAAAAAAADAPAYIKDVTEYLVIQRRMIRGVQQPWLVWGTTQETTLDELDRRAAASAAPAAAEASGGGAGFGAKA